MAENSSKWSVAICCIEINLVSVCLGHQNNDQTWWYLPKILFSLFIERSWHELQSELFEWYTFLHRTLPGTVKKVCHSNSSDCSSCPEFPQESRFSQFLFMCRVRTGGANFWTVCVIVYFFWLFRPNLGSWVQKWPWFFSSVTSLTYPWLAKN